MLTAGVLREQEYLRTNVVDPEELGGNANLTIATGRTEARVKIARCRLKEPGMVQVQMSQTGIDGSGKQASTSHIQAQVDWGAGRGTQTATVDIGLGTTFTVSAAQIVDITVILTGTAGDNVQIQCTMAPCTATNPIPALLTSNRIQLVAGVLSAAFAIPSWSRKLFVFTDDENATAGTIVRLRTGITTVVRAFVGTAGPIVLKDTMDNVQFLNPIAVVNLWPVWELVL